MNLDSKNIDAEEVARFAAHADLWWDRNGQYKALHEINPVRLDYIRRRAGLKGRQVLDVGCGGGLLSEAMAAAGAKVAAIDMAEPSLTVAREHARRHGHTIAYRQSTAEAWSRDHEQAYDIVTCMELVEHVPDPPGLIRACGRMLRPGGDLFLATVNRTWLARVLVIWVSEYVLGIVPKQTHTYAKFVRPAELTRWGRQAGLGVENISGLRYIPFGGYAGLCKDTFMNYLMHFTKPPASA